MNWIYLTYLPLLTVIVYSLHLLCDFERFPRFWSYSYIASWFFLAVSIAQFIFVAVVMLIIILGG